MEPLWPRLLLLRLLLLSSLGSICAQLDTPIETVNGKVPGFAPLRTPIGFKPPQWIHHKAQGFKPPQGERTTIPPPELADLPVRHTTTEPTMWTTTMGPPAWVRRTTIPEWEMHRTERTTIPEWARRTTIPEWDSETTTAMAPPHDWRGDGSGFQRAAPAPAPHPATPREWRDKIRKWRAPHPAPPPAPPREWPAPHPAPPPPAPPREWRADGTAPAPGPPGTRWRPQFERPRAEQAFRRTTQPPPEYYTTTISETEHYNPDLPPLIIIPPLTGSILQADIDRDKLRNPLCRLPFPKQLWPPGGTTVLSGMLECFQEEMSLLVDAQASRSQQTEVVHEPPGVHIHTTAYGDVHKSQQPGTWEMTLEQLHILGYKEGKNMFAAPFDWRHGPGDWKNRAWPRLKDAIEGWVSDVHGRPAILISLSMGASYLQAFFLHADGVDAAWKRKHVAGFVSMSGVFGGTLAAMSAGLWGNPFPVAGQKGRAALKNSIGELGQQLLKKKGMEYAKVLLRGFGAVAWLMPQWKKQQKEARTLIALPPAWGGNITDEMLTRLLADEGYPDGLEALYEVAAQFPTESHPGVPVVCMYGINRPTPYLVAYSGDHKSEDLDDVKKTAMDMAEHQLRGAGMPVNNEKLKEGVTDILGDVVDMVRGPQSTTPAPPVPEGPPEGSKVGDPAWIASAARLVQARLPDVMVNKPGDGIVEHESLAVCDSWKGMPGVKDVEVLRYPGFRHAQEVRDQKAQFDFRAVIAKLAGVPNPENRSSGLYRPSIIEPECEMRAPGQMCPEFDDKRCTEKAMKGLMTRGDRCCVEANELASCAGTKCMHQFVGQALMDRHSYAETMRMQAACRFSWFPSQIEIRRMQMQAFRQMQAQKQLRAQRQAEENEDDEAPVSEKCIAKALGAGCPQFRDIRTCNRQAMKGELWSRSHCCMEMESIATCMGKGCFAGAVFTMLAMNRDSQTGLMTLAKWKQGCRNVNFPSPQDMQKVAGQAADLTVKAAQIKEVAEDFMQKKGLTEWWKKFRGGADKEDTDDDKEDSEDEDEDEDDDDSDDAEDGRDEAEEIVDDSNDGAHAVQKPKALLKSTGPPEGPMERLDKFTVLAKQQRQMLMIGIAAGMASFILLSVAVLLSIPSSRRYVFRLCKRRGRRVVTAQDVALQPAGEGVVRVEPEEALLPQSGFGDDAEVYQALQSPRR